MSDEHPVNVLAVDFDKTLAFYDHYRGEDHLGEPIPKMVENVKHWLSQGIKVRIFTARGGDEKQVELIKKWCKKYIGEELEVTNIKGFDIQWFVDDRALSAEPNVGNIEFPKWFS